jgi:hypothetical protein
MTWYPKSATAFWRYVILDFDGHHYSLKINVISEDIPMQIMTAKLIEHHSVLTVFPQSAHIEFDGSTLRIVIKVLGTTLFVLVVLSLPPVRRSLISCDPEAVLLLPPPLELNISPMGCLLIFCCEGLGFERSRVVAEPSKALSIAFLIA